MESVSVDKKNQFDASITKIILFCFVIFVFIFISNNLILNLSRIVPSEPLHIYNFSLSRQFLFVDVIFSNFINFLFIYSVLRCFRIDLKTLGWPRSGFRKTTWYYLVALVPIIFFYLIFLFAEKISAPSAPILYWIKLILGYVLVIFPAALFEEIVFRGVLLSLLIKRTNFFWANFAQAIIFGLCHFFVHPMNIIAWTIIPMGLIFGLIKNKTGSIKASTTAHAIMNTFAFLLEWVKI